MEAFEVTFHLASMEGFEAVSPASKEASKVAFLLEVASMEHPFLQLEASEEACPSLALEGNLLKDTLHLVGSEVHLEEVELDLQEHNLVQEVARMDIKVMKLYNTFDKVI